MNKFTPFVKSFLPPFIYQKIKNNSKFSVTFKGRYSSWAEAANVSLGYDSSIILDRVLEASLKVQNGEALYERDSVLFNEIQYSWPLAAALGLTAGEYDGNLHVLDFGGALGSTYFANRNLIKSFKRVTWSIVEQQNYVKAGNKYFSNDILTFYDTIQDAKNQNPINCVILSAVLQYLENPYDIIAEICKLKPAYIILDQTITNNTENNSYHVQLTPSSIYKASYPCSSLSEKKLMNQMAPHYDLVAKFDSLDFPTLAQINSTFNGYIMKDKNEKFD